MCVRNFLVVRFQDEDLLEEHHLVGLDETVQRASRKARRERQREKHGKAKAATYTQANRRMAKAHDAIDALRKAQELLYAADLAKQAEQLESDAVDAMPTA